METILTRQFLDACFNARQIFNLLPPLPSWMTPRQIKVVDAIYQLQKTQDDIRISDIAHYMSGTMPSITRMVSDLESHGILTKNPNHADKRANSIALTAYGEEFFKQYVKDFHEQVTKKLNAISEEDLRTAIVVIELARELLMDDTH